jgi:putative spermidine/putrescine transport system permease protein
MARKLIIGLFILITLGPLAMGLGYSVLYSFGTIGLLSKGFTLDYWLRLFSETDALQSLTYSLLLTLGSMIITLFIALGIAWVFVTGYRATWFYKSLFIPLLFPPLIAAFIWYYILSPSGIISRMAYQTSVSSGIDDFPQWVNDPWSFGILLTHVALVLPVFTLLFIELARKEKISDLLLSSQTLGGSRWFFFRKTFAPLLWLRSQPVLWMYGIFLFGTYEVPLLLGQSSPRPITLFITDKLTRYNLNDIPLAHAMSVVYCLFILLVVGVFMRARNHKLA